MSELINNREMRKETLKNIIKQLHEGKTVDQVKGQFDKAFDGVAASEISEAEAALVAEGVPVEEIQSLCDVHAAVFKDSLEEQNEPVMVEGHPLNILWKENRELEKLIQNKVRPNLKLIKNPDNLQLLKRAIEYVLKIDIHYAKKENLLFPYLEKYGVTAPPKVMWGVDDEIRLELKLIQKMMEEAIPDLDEVVARTNSVMERIEEMIFKEENILFPMLVEKLTEDEWALIANESKEYGYLIDHIPQYSRTVNQESKEDENEQEAGVVKLPSGHFTVDELRCMLNTLPFDITFVNKNDKVCYFTEGKERIFARTRTVVGRNVSNCHPPASVHIVENIVEDFKAGKKDHEDFWIQRGDAFVYIRYFAVRDEQGEYLGVLEVTQNVHGIRALQGEKRLVED